MTMVISVDHKLRVARSALPPETLDYIVKALSIPNIEREKQAAQKIWGWQHLPETIDLWEIDSETDELVMPRGFSFALFDGFEYLNIEPEIVDRRNFEILPQKGDVIDLRRWQEPAVEAILTAQDGIWKAPAGSGKTVGVLEAIRRVSGRSIVLVNTKDILWQWQERALSFLGSDFPVGQIGDGVFDVSPYLTIATAQTLHSRFRDLERDGFFDDFTFMCLDECHHSTAETYNRIVDRFSSTYRIGVSATPDKTGDFALAKNVLGPIFHETRPKDVDSLMRPEVYKIPTRFEFGYRGAMGRRPSNYPSLLKYMVEDDDRNDLIVKCIMRNLDHHCLVISKRLDHLNRLADKLDRAGFPHRIMMLTGSESTEARQEVVAHASNFPCVVFSTLADEALDIPRLDRLFLVFPQRNAGLITQQVGRVERIHPDKADAKIYDFADLKIGPCESQWRVRRLEVYNQRGYEVTVLRPDDI